MYTHTHTHTYIYKYNIISPDLTTAGFTALGAVRDGGKSAEEQPGGGQVDKEGDEAVELLVVGGWMDGWMDGYM